LKFLFPTGAGDDTIAAEGEELLSLLDVAKYSNPQINNIMMLAINRNT
jgi:hypothetical protein